MTISSGHPSSRLAMPSPGAASNPKSTARKCGLGISIIPSDLAGPVPGFFIKDYKCFDALTKTKRWQIFWKFLP
jgi:hypothetical protein